MTEITPTLPVVPPPSAIHPSLRHLFDAHRPVDEPAGVLQPIELPEGDPLRFDLTARREYSRHEVGETGPLERNVAFVYDLATGDRLLTRALPAEWWWENMGHVPDETLRSWLRYQPNHWLATDRHLIVSGGLWWRGSDSPTGDLVYTSVTQVESEYRERYRHTQRHWGKLHATAIDAFRPAWADRVEFHGDEDLLEAEGMTFTRAFGKVTIRLEVERRAHDAPPQHGDVDGFHPTTGVPLIDVSDLDGELPATEAAAAALSITTALAALTGEKVTIEAGPDVTEPSPA